jgi:hypothetical protein
MTAQAGSGKRHRIRTDWHLELLAPSRSYSNMRYRVGRILQAIALFVIIPFAVAGNLAEVAGSPQSLSLRDSLLLAGIGCILFYVGRAIQGPTAGG